MQVTAPPPANGSPAKKRIFLSYGRDEHLVDALRIKADLELRGHKVWFDLESLREGRDWETEIERGLGECDLMVLLLTPHSVRRRDTRDPNSCDGYCLNEIASALQRKKLIIPVLLVTLEPDGPPTSICRYQYLDLRDAVPIADREAVYQSRFDRLIRAIDMEDLDFEGGQARLIRLLQPLRFEEDIGKHIAGFHGRVWLFEEIDRWLYAQPESRVFWLTGKPGVGKTAIAARLCHSRREILAYHLCKATDDDKRDPARAVLSIAYQISQHLPEYERALHSVDLEAESLKNAQTLFNNLVVRPLRTGSPRPDGPRIVIIDAIDEATRNGRNEIAALIADSWEDTPPWLRLIITSRPEEAEVVARLSRLRPYRLDTQSAENMNDLREYLERGLASRSLPSESRIVHEILQRSEGLFLYVTVVLDDLQQELLSVDRIEEFPIGLGGHYQQFFERQFPDLEEYKVKIRPMLEAICAQREPLPLPILKRALGATMDLLPGLGKLGSLFPRTSQRGGLDSQSVTPFHKSIRDWLTMEFGPYAIDLAAGESRLANIALSWEGLAAGPAQRYLLRHGVPHLVNAGQFAEACELMYALLHLPQIPHGITLEQLQGAGLYLCAGLADCPRDQVRLLPAEKLVDIVVECAGIDHYAMLPPFRILYSDRRSEWPGIRRRIIQSGHFSAMYAVSLVLAEAHAKRPGSVLSEINELTTSPDLNEQELGLYAFKLLEGDPSQLMEGARKFAAFGGFLIPALLHEFLLTQALVGEDACEFIRSAGLWNARWPYHRTQLDDIAAVQELVRKSPTPFSAEPGVVRAREELGATLRNRDELLASPAIAAEPILHDLLRNWERLPRKLNDLPAAAQSIRRSALMDRLLLLLFAHPAWEVRAGVSTIAAAGAGRQEATLLIADWIDHPDYRVRYTAIEAAYRIRHQDDAALFEKAVHRYADDGQAWVRGIVADCLAEWVAREDKQDHARRLERFKPEVTRLLHDTDLWPLEATVQLVRQLREEGVDALATIGPIGGLLARVNGWDTLQRSEFQLALDALLPKSLN